MDKNLVPIDFVLQTSVQLLVNIFWKRVFSSNNECRKWMLYFIGNTCKYSGEMKLIMKFYLNFEVYFLSFPREIAAIYSGSRFLSIKSEIAELLNERKHSNI